MLFKFWEKKIYSDKMDSYTIIKHVLSTEKSIRLMELENKLIFVVNNKATKKEIKKTIEEMFKVEVGSVRTFVSPNGEKRAYVKFLQKHPAIDIATQMGII